MFIPKLTKTWQKQPNRPNIFYGFISFKYNGTITELIPKNVKYTNKHTRNKPGNNYNRKYFKSPDKT